MFKRTLSDKLAFLARQFPVISITGPRQSGKTTLARTLFSEHTYVSLEDPDEREFALTDPKGFLRRFGGGVILDEIQRAPALLSYLQGIVDSEDRPGRFILTGSQQFQVMEKVTQTLAGRTALVNLLPLSLDELLGRQVTDPLRPDELPPPSALPDFSLEQIIFKGLYPRIHDKRLEPHDWLSAYYRTYVERDVRDVANIGNLPKSIEEKYKKCDATVVEIRNPIEQYEYILDDYVVMENGFVRHDADLLARRIFETYVK